MDKWEYRILSRNDKDNNETLLNELGKEGWELVSTVSSTHAQGRMYYYLKRKL